MSRWWMRIAVLCCSSVPALAGQVHVPGDFVSIPAAIQGSPAGTTIVVHGGVHSNFTIDKPLAIVGAPQFTVTFQDQDAGGLELPAVTLAGPGSGTVRLARVLISGQGGGNQFTTVAPAIQGGGFAQLEVLHAHVNGEDGIPGSFPPFPSINGGAGIDVTVPYVVVADSIVTGGRNGHMWVGNGSAPPPGIGIHAPLSTVLLLDSQVIGGESPGQTFQDAFTSCPTCFTIENGDGAAGIVAKRIHRANSVVSGGAGGAFSCESDDPNQTGPICSKSPGPAIVAETDIVLGGALAGSGPIVLSQPWTLTWSASSNPALLVAAPALAPPAKVAGSWFFLDGASLIVGAVPGGALQSLTVTLAANPALVGAAVGMQLYDGPLGLTRPVVAALVP